MPHCVLQPSIKSATDASQGAEWVAWQLKAAGFGRDNGTQPAQLLASFFAQTAPVMAAWEAGTRRYRYAAVICTAAAIKATKFSQIGGKLASAHSHMQATVRQRSMRFHSETTNRINTMMSSFPQAPAAGHLGGPLGGRRLAQGLCRGRGGPFRCDGQPGAHHHAGHHSPCGGRVCARRRRDARHPGRRR